MSSWKQRAVKWLLQDHKCRRAGHLFIVLGRWSCWIMKEVIWSLGMRLSRHTWVLQPLSWPWQWSISGCGFSWSTAGLALHTHLPAPRSPSNPGTHSLLEMPVLGRGHAYWTLKQGYVRVQCRTRLKLWLDANDTGNCQETSLFFLDVYCFFTCCSIVERTLSKQDLVNFF